MPRFEITIVAAGIEAVSPTAKEARAAVEQWLDDEIITLSDCDVTIRVKAVPERATETTEVADA